jgi:hypothetical protein
MPAASIEVMKVASCCVFRCAVDPNLDLLLALRPEIWAMVPMRALARRVDNGSSPGGSCQTRRYNMVHKIDSAHVFAFGVNKGFRGLPFVVYSFRC